MTDLTTLTPAQIATLTPAELAAHTAEELGALTAEQVGAITTAQMAVLSPDQLDALAPAMAQWQQFVQDYQMATSTAAAAARSAYLAPINDILSSDAFAEVRAAVAALPETYGAGEAFESTLKCLRVGTKMTAVA